MFMYDEDFDPNNEENKDFLTNQTNKEEKEKKRRRRKKQKKKEKEGNYKIPTDDEIFEAIKKK